MSDTVMLAAIAVLGPVVVSIAAFFISRSNKREDWRRQDEVAEQVAKVARLAAESSKTLVGIAETGEATHRTSELIHEIVNNQKTTMIRTVAVSARALANAFPDDPVLRKTADDAEHDLEENIKENENVTGKGKPIKVVVTNETQNPVPTQPVPTEPAK